MIERKKVAVIAVAEYFTLLEENVKQGKKVRWTDHRVGWASQPRDNWIKLK